MTNNNVQPLKEKKLTLSAQAQQYLTSLIEEGIYQPGQQFPSEADLATQLGISRATLREALLNLEQEGAIIRKHGVGTFVAPSYGQRLEGGLERLESILALASRQGLELAYDDLEVSEEPAGKALAEILQVPPGANVTCVRRVIMADGKPVAFMWDAILASVLSPAEVNGRFAGSVLDLLRNKADFRVAQAVAYIIALNADRLLAEKLEIERGRAVLLLEELLYDEEGTPVEFSRNYFVPDFFRFHVVRR
jgi:GntR family transcriptional regulator